MCHHSDYVTCYLNVDPIDKREHVSYEVPDFKYNLESVNIIRQVLQLCFN